MKKVVNGKIYNTDTAIYITTYSNGYNPRDFNQLSERLYKTKKGAFFLAGEGGPLTKYAKPCGDMTMGSEDIFVLTADEAQGWLEQHNKTAELEEHFGDSIEEA